MSAAGATEAALRLYESIGDEVDSSVVVASVNKPVSDALVGALREGMLKLAAREADGTIINWLSADDVKRVAEVVKQDVTIKDGTIDFAIDQHRAFLAHIGIEATEADREAWIADHPQAHQPDEYVRLDDIAASMKVMALATMRLMHLETGTA